MRERSAVTGRKLEFSPMGLGIWQLVLILLIVLIVFGSAKLPKAMADVAESLRNFRAGIRDDEEHKRLPTSEAFPPEIANGRPKLEEPTESS